MNVSGKRASRLLSTLLAISMLTGLLTVGSAAYSPAGNDVHGGLSTARQAAGAELVFTYPEDVDPDETTLTLYKGFPTSSSSTLEKMISSGQLTEVPAQKEDVYTITEPGLYSYHIYGDGYYNILKILNITQEDLADDIQVEVVGGPLGANDDPFGDGYQPTVKPSHAPESYVMDSRDSMLCIWPDEVLAHFTTQGTTHDGPYDTPAFDGTDADHEFTTQNEMVAFMEDRDEKCDYMYLYSAGRTPNYDFDIPLALFTQTAIPEDASLEEAAALVRGNGKLTVWYQTQIHPNEPAAGEGALVVVDNFLEDPEARALLEDINLVVVPRINPDGSYLFSRATYDGFDMNRDHMSLKAAELAQLHTAYRLFMAEVVLDGHEFTFYGASTEKETGKAYMSNAYDLETTPATSLNNDPAVTAIALEMCGETFQAARDAGLRVYHYGTTVNNPIGRAYFGLYDCVSFLIETRGIGAGKTNFERRVFSQETAIMSYLEGAAQRADEIRTAVAAARAETVEKGKVYGEEDDLLYLHQTASGETMTDYYGLNTQYYLDGTLKREEQVFLSLNDTGKRTRVRPTAYVIPADTENIDQILYIMDNQGAEYYMISGDEPVELQQYYFVQEDGSNSCIADLRASAPVAFPEGAYVFPMDQVAGDVIAMLVEPDVTDSKGYDGTLYQYGLVNYDPQSKNFPLYRYVGNDPRTSLPAASVELVFQYPDDVPADEVKLSVFQGIPQWVQKNDAKSVEDVPRVLTDPEDPDFPKLIEIQPNEQGKYLVNEAGGYCYFVRGKEPSQYYNIIKLFIVSPDDLKAGSKSVPVKTGPSAGTGFETGNNQPAGTQGERPPEGFDQGVQHLVPIEGTDEMEHLLGTDELVGYQPFTTPAFQEGRAMYQATTQSEMMAFIQEYAAKSEYMHVYSAGKTENLGYDYPVLVFTKKDIPAGATMEEAAEILQKGGLPIVWQQAQIHPYEPAAGESALVMIQELCGDYGEEMLDKIDIVMIPRVNVEGGFLFWRGDYNGVDMNRDHMAVTSHETALLHETYYKFMPHVVIDNHEFFFSEMGNYQNDPERYKLNDFQITGATSLNDDPEITDLTTNLVVDQMHKDLLDTGFRAYHYGITSTNPIGRAYYGLGNAISVLIESHGADGALFAMPRRVYGQVVATKSVFETTAANAQRIVKAVNDARAEVAEKGRTYEENDLLVLKQSASGAVTSPTPLPEYVADIYGNIESLGEKTISLQDTVVRARTRPTAYLVDADEPWLEELTYILDHHNAEYFYLKDGVTVEQLQQYYYIQPDGAKSCIADLRKAADVTFKHGALMIPMDQEMGNIIGMLMEPDVGDSASYNGTLYQYRLMDYDPDTMNFPLYRYTQDDPRDLLDDGGSTGTISPTRYDIQVEDSSHGTVKASRTSASRGTRVTLTVTPSKGYVLDSLTVRDKDGDRITLQGSGLSYTFTMPASDVTVTAKFSADSGLPFQDVKSGAWYYDAVEYAYENKLFKGTSDTTFSPDVPMTRGMLITVLYSMEGSPKVAGNLTFRDVADDAWYRNAVLWGVKQELISGYSAQSYGPEDIVTREQMAQILRGYAAYKGYGVTASGSLEGFKDASDASDWAVRALKWAVGEKLLAGKGGGMLEPGSGATRAEVAQILMRFQQEVAGK